jgi:hypothetical protein
MVAKTDAKVVAAVCEELSSLTKLELSTIPAAGRPSRQRYFREGKEQSIEAQYWMLLESDSGCGEMLSLGLSIEKCNKRVPPPEWDWNRLVALTAKVLNDDVAAVSKALKRPVGVIVQSTLDDEVVEPIFVFEGGRWCTDAAPVGAEDVHRYLRRCNDANNSKYWVDVFVVAQYPVDFGAEKQRIDRKDSKHIAKILHKFTGLREKLRGR